MLTNSKKLNKLLFIKLLILILLELTLSTITHIIITRYVNVISNMKL